MVDSGVCEVLRRRNEEYSTEVVQVVVQVARWPGGAFYETLGSAPVAAATLSMSGLLDSVLI